METLTKPTDTRLRRFTETGTVYPILFMISITHLLNDMMQSVIPAVYPLLKEKFGFTFAQIGIITLVFQMTSSLLQPFIGLYADRHPRPYSLAAGMCFTLVGLLILSVAPGFVPILLAVGLIGCGSSVFHPESSRVAQLASGGRKGLAQSIFQVGGNAGGAMGPLLAALVVIPFGQASIGWFALAAILAILILTRIGNCYKLRLTVTANRPAAAAAAPAHHLGKRKIRLALGILGVLVFSKYFYIASMTNYFTFFLMDKFGISVQGSQYCLFAFLGAAAVGTVGGGPLGDALDLFFSNLRLDDLFFSGGLISLSFTFVPMLLFNVVKTGFNFVVSAYDTIADLFHFSHEERDMVQYISDQQRREEEKEQAQPAPGPKPVF